jgi:hypothetical protein
MKLEEAQHSQFAANVYAVLAHLVQWLVYTGARYL